MVARRDLLGRLANDSASYFETLVEFEAVAIALDEAARSYADFIRERILWVRSIPSERGASLSDLRETGQWLLDREVWSRTWVRVHRDLMTDLPTYVLSVGLLAGLWVAAGWCSRRLRFIAGQVGRLHSDSFKYTLEAVGLTFVIAVPAPAMLWWLGWVIGRPLDQTELALAVAQGLKNGVQLLLLLLLLRHVMGPKGLGPAHFGWARAVTDHVRRHVRWLTPVLVICVVLITTLYQAGLEAAVASVGRLAFTLVALSVSVAFWRLFRPSSPFVTELLRTNPQAWLTRLRYVWFPLLVAAPIALVIIAWLGYFYSALQLAVRLEQTLGLAVLVLFLYGLLQRWLLVARRHLAIEEAKRRRDQALAEARAKSASDDAPSDITPLVIDEDSLDLPAISSQSQELFRTLVFVTAAVGLFLIWSADLPALRALNWVQLYPQVRVVEATGTRDIALLSGGAAPPATTGAASDAGPAGKPSPTAPSPTPALPGETGEESASRAENEPITITLADVALALLILALTFIAFRNLPGLVEMFLLQRLPLDSGARHALQTVLTYAIAIIGVVAACSMVGITWSRVQWLAAALTFGLAFGLQEIVANFVSGLIILAERPIRIGDTVTVGNVSGTVTRIRIRATTITDWDRKEMVIPNKTFITQDVINWTLSDPTLRIIIPVGVSYGADIHKAEQTLLDIARAHPKVLSDPKPTALFASFGDSTLNFELRVYIPSIEHLVSVRHDLHKRITEKFREADIEIAFPQRDINVRSVEGLQELVQKRESVVDVE